MKTVIVALVLSLSISGCNGNAKPAASKQTEMDAETVEVVPVASQKFSTVITLPAQLVPFETVDIYPRVTGFMDMIRVDRGSRVRKGELIIRLSAPELVAQRTQAASALRAAEAQLTTAQAKLTSDNGTYLHVASAAKTPGVVAENDVMVARQTVSADQGQVQSAENNVAAAREALRSVGQLESYLNIYAPFEGIVTTRNLHHGALVGPASGQSGTMPIVQIVDTSHLRLVVPVSAVTNDQQRTFVERVRDAKAEWVDVVTGLSVGGNIEVFGDLKPGDEVIRNATDAIRPGQQMKTGSPHS